MPDKDTYIVTMDRDGHTNWVKKPPKKGVSTFWKVVLWLEVIAVFLIAYAEAFG